MPSNTQLIAITGSHSTGKTTLINDLSRSLNSKGLDHSVISEIPREICRQLGDDAFHRDKNTLSKQTMLMMLQLARERAATSRITLSDRTILDHWIYTKNTFNATKEFIELRDILFSAVADSLSAYRLILYIPIEIPLQQDDVREDDKAFQRQIDKDIKESLLNTGINFSTISGNPIERADKTIKILENEGII
ncbi:ATP-binding protein [Cerasicoccus frondis]|uniref:ATP-binding protein n=1 Tax=Cerasicoccus frondis TaxID=490090 RepID=UPI002852B914|nr:ATP-binding protein [Cerasicoccus frondis]